jgi:hypothetical protein
MDYKNENIDDVPDFSEEDALLTPRMISPKDRRNLSDYNRLIKKGFLSTLTLLEYRVWRLYANTGSSIPMIADSLDISKREVKKYISQVVNKLKIELEIEKDWSKPVKQKFSRTGTQKGIKTVSKVSPDDRDVEQVDKLFKERIRKYQKEVDAFLKKHPLVRRKMEE